MTRLTAVPHDGTGAADLYLGDDILLVQYMAGDCDAINWPFAAGDAARLASALYGEFECGRLTERTVELPDGTLFDIDANLEEVTYD